MRTVCTFCGKTMRNKPLALVVYDTCACCKRKVKRRAAEVMATRQGEKK